MAGYSTSAPPILVAQRIGGGVGQIWTYRTTDAVATVDAANYFTNGGSLGMVVGGVLFSTDTDASPISQVVHTINATGDGTTDITDGVAITETNSD